jgi:hypothetical protein
MANRVLIDVDISSSKDLLNSSSNSFVFHKSLGDDDLTLSQVANNLVLATPLLGNLLAMLLQHIALCPNTFIHNQSPECDRHIL